MNSKVKVCSVIFMTIVIYLTMLLLFACDRISEYTVIYIAQAGGSITGTLEQSVRHSKDGTQVIAVPDVGYEFVKWSDGNTEAQRIDFNVTENKVLTAEFRKKTYTITYVAQTGGRITGTLIQNVEYGADGTEVIAVPDVGYEFIGWSDYKLEANRTDTDVMTNKTLTAEFREKICTIKYTAQTGGSISGLSDQNIEYGKNGAHVEAVPQTGYEFVRWSDGSTDARRADRNVTESKTFTAEFRKKTYTLAYVAQIGGRITGTLIQNVEYGANGTEVIAVPDVGYEFIKWSDNATSTSRIDTDVATNKTLTAEFRKKICTIKYTAQPGGSISGICDQKIEYGENGTQVEAVPDIGYEFIKWSDGSTDARRSDCNVTESVILTARFEKKTYTLKYSSGIGGDIEGSVTQSVKYNESGIEVTAKPKSGYAFLGWSDGVKTAERIDCDVISNISVTAYFGFSVEYGVDEKFSGGHIVGENYQVVAEGDNFAPVKAVANVGYVFVGWSDLSLNTDRQDMSAERSLKIFAYFEPIEKTFAYEYGERYGIPFSTSVTIDRHNITDTEFVVPKLQGYSFDGWYAEKECLTKVANKDGRYMLGYYGFTLETDTIYAKWIKDDENSVNTNKVLLVFVNTVDATLYSTPAERDIEVQYKMTGIERELCYQWLKEFNFYLNDWLGDITKFEVDAYYTTITIDSENFTKGLSNGKRSHNLFANKITEIGNLVGQYHNTLTIFGMNDYDYLLHFSDGVSERKNGCVNIEGMLYSYMLNHIPLQDVVEQFRSEILASKPYVSGAISSLMHEFTHTCELNFDGEIMAYHDVLAMSGALHVKQWELTRLYLIGQFGIDGKLNGIPRRYWNHEIEIYIYYGPSSYYEPGSISGKRVGRVNLIGTETDEDNVSICVPYDSNISVEAVPDEGFRFVKWSDGVTTAIRHDKNIIAYFRVEAIFEKI